MSQISKSLRIAIIGGGIGGMALALALHDAGFKEIDVYESDATISTLGVGINVLPHAVRELTELGLQSALAAAGVATSALVFHTKRGERIWSESRGIAAGYRWPQYSIHRGELLGAIAAAVVDRLGASRVHTARQLERFESASTNSTSTSTSVVRAVFSDGSAIECDLLVGCDGMHSRVRRQMFPDEGAPLWNGVTMYRGITRSQTPLLNGETMVMCGYFARRVVLYSISPKQTMINWVAEVKLADNQPMPAQAWQHRTTAEEAVSHFTDFVFDFVDVPSLIRNADAIFKYPMVDREPLDSWLYGDNVTLLGDAAHPMYPVGSNGASQAILDARVLAQCLCTHTDLKQALSAYDADRRVTTAAVVRANRKVGPEACMELVEQRAPNGFSDLSSVVTEQELREISDSYKRLAGYDPIVLNNRASLSAQVSN